MRGISLFGLLAMMPAAFNVAPAAARGALTVALCTGDGVARTVQVPSGAQDIPGARVPGCCAKGCHTGQSRKRNRRSRDVDPAQ
ncbi:hypothetical protein GTZ99_13035 [Novosphingobium sp. FSY-8]|uniref:Uncharacterized protein n=1 Tax=Novosphingobium ovatum TaxID=1908523 RepID=A0ABW9XG11_9SPHN|nr:hypothetical protein [Novosphingobium ovatum]NBC37473.1 hypothetical protein [Novosphingobium ovatum]